MKEQKKYDAQDFNSLYKELDDLYHDVALEIGIPDSALTVLYTVCRIGGGCLQKDVCGQAYVSKQTVNSAIRKLEAAGYLYLAQGKGRDKHIYLTDAGEKFAAEKVLPIVTAEDNAFSSLTPSEQQELFRLMKKYADNFRRNLKNTRWHS